MTTKTTVLPKEFMEKHFPKCCKCGVQLAFFGDGCPKPQFALCDGCAAPIVAKKKLELRKKAVEVMLSGGRMVCDDAIDKWWKGTYKTNKEQQQRSIDEWREVRDLIAEICSELKRDMKGM